MDRNEVPDDIVRAIHDSENIPLDLSFAPLSLSPPGYTAPSPVTTHSEKESEEETESMTGYSEGLSDCPTVEIDLDVTDVRIPLGLLRAWKRNAEIRPLINIQTQTSPMISPPGSPASLSEYSLPNYSPVRLEDLDEFECGDFDYLNESFNSDSEEENLISDTEVNRILDFLEEEYLESEPKAHYKKL